MEALSQTAPPRPQPQLLATNHPAFGSSAAIEMNVSRDRHLLATSHPAFCAVQTSVDSSTALERERFVGPVSVGGLFLSVSPTLTLPFCRARLTPNCQLTVRDANGGASRLRYTCRLRGAEGPKLEALLRCQVGWIAPRVTFTELPYRLNLGRGIDVSIPWVLHFTAISILDERGNNTGSCLFFSGTPLMGFSVGFTRIEGGELIYAARRPANPEQESKHFIANVHYRQLGFLLLKLAGYLVCGLAFLLNVEETVAHVKETVSGFISSTVDVNNSHALRRLTKLQTVS
jgi:hypothetical protein